MFVHKSKTLVGYTWQGEEVWRSRSGRLYREVGEAQVPVDHSEVIYLNVETLPRMQDREE